MLISGYTGSVYIATNQRNGRAYIGKTVKPLALRKAAHKRDAEAGRSPGLLAKAIRAHGFDAFVWAELFMSDDDETLCAVEREIIADYRAHGYDLYNLTDGGQGFAGLIRTPEHRAKLSAIFKGREISKEQAQRHSVFMSGRKLSAEHRAAISAGMKGYTQSPSHTAKITAFHSGRKRSLETRARVSEANKRRWLAKRQTP